MSKNAMLDAALAYAARGWHVFPAKFDGKSKRGYTSAAKSNGNPWGYTRDPAEIEAYWRRWPQAAIGLPTGAVNGFFVVDADTMEGHGKDGIGNLRLLQDQHGDLPFTKGATSPSGSHHYYFQQPRGERVTTKSDKLAPGVDVVGDGGYVVAPPSVRPGRGEYRWFDTIGTARISRAPSWLLGLVVDSRVTPGAGPASPSRAIDPASCPPEMLAAMAADGGKGLDPTENVELKIEIALEVIPPDVDYWSWFYIGCALYNELGDAGAETFASWSRGDKYGCVAAKFDPNACEAKWLECKKPPKPGREPRRAGTIYRIADMHDPEWRELYEREIAVARAAL